MLVRIYHWTIKSTPFYGIILACAILLNACNDPEPSASNASSIPSIPPIQLVFVYDWEKKAWIDAVTTQFNLNSHKISNGQPIQVKAIAKHSVQLIDEVLDEIEQVHLISPASTAFIKLGNAKSQALLGKDMVFNAENLVLSPLVIALWKPMAKALGWNKKNLGWHDILALTNSQGWATYYYPQWGRFKLGHPHPEYSNIGLLALFTQVYAGLDKLGNLTRADIKQAKTYLHKIQQTVAHYRQSSRFFYRELLDNGPNYLSAALLSENQVVQSYQHYNLAVELVAIYPKEGTVWSEHPIGILKRDWVTSNHYEAARNYIDYLLAKPQQEKALQYGFRPANVSVPLTTPIDAEHGVNPQAPQLTLEMPSAPVIDAILNLWKHSKKPANIAIVLDISGGMRGDKIRHARATIMQLLQKLNDVDSISILVFNDKINWVSQAVLLGKQRERLQRQVKHQFTGGSTALYDAISQAYDSLLNNFAKISTILVLSEGEDSQSSLTFKDLLRKIQFDNDKRPIRISTIGYGTQAEKNHLKDIANISQGQFYDGTASNSSEIVKDLIAFLN